MPLYEYKCETCHEKTEILQRVSDPPLAHCPHCGGPMRKLISAPGIQFKGSGFYKTDYANSSSSKREETAKGESKPEPGSKGESKSE